MFDSKYLSKTQRVSCQHTVNTNELGTPMHFRYHADLEYKLQVEVDRKGVECIRNTFTRSLKH